MSTLAAAGPLRAPSRDASLAIAAAALLAVALAATLQISIPLFAAAAALTLAFTAYAAHRWPRTTLVSVALLTVADLAIVPKFLPEGRELGPIGASEPLLAVTGLVIAIDAIRHGTFIKAFRGPMLPLTGLFIGVAVLSALINATPPTVALLGIVMTVDAIAIYFVWRMLPGGVREATWATGAIVVLAMAAAIFGIAQVVLDPNLWGFYSFQGRFGEGARITSFFGNPNMLAPVLAFALPFPLYASLRLATPRHRWIARLAAFILVLALLLTFSRGSWLAVGLGATIGTLLLDRRALLLLVLLVPLAWATALVMPRELALGSGGGPAPEVPDVIGTTFDRFSGEADIRIRFLVDGLRIIDDHVLLGVGPGRYGGAAATIIPTPVYDEYDTGLGRYRTVHNFWLHLLGEVGAVGTAVFLTMVVSLLIRYVRAAWASDGLRFVLLAGVATSTLVIIFNNMTEMLFEGNAPGILIWLLLAVGSTLAPSPRLRSTEGT